MEAREGVDVVVDVPSDAEQRQHPGGPAELGARERVGLELAVGRAEPALHVGHLAVELGEPDGQEVAGQRLVVVRRGDLLDLVAELGQQRGGATRRPRPPPGRGGR